jgi:hypothetical protein
MSTTFRSLKHYFGVYVFQTVKIILLESSLVHILSLKARLSGLYKMLTDNLNWLTSQNELSAGLKSLLSLGKQFSGFCYLLSLNERLSGPLIWVTTFMLLSKGLSL